MIQRGRVWAILAASYVTATAVIQLLWRGGASPTVETTGRAAAVLVVQMGAFEIAARLARVHRRDVPVDGVAVFLIVWLFLASAFGLATLAFGVAVRKVDLTSVVVFSVMAVPAVQSWAIAGALGHGAAPAVGWRSFVRHPLTRPVLVLDALMLVLGLALPEHPLIGLAAVGLVQRRWVGTKLLAAAVLLVAAAMRCAPRSRSPSLWLLAIALGGLGIDTFAPWLFGVSLRLPSPLSLQPPSIIWLEIYGTAALVVLTLTIGARRALAPRAVEASSLLASGAVALFVATLALLMNGFLSLDPVFPWGPVALTAGSLAASGYAGAALELSSDGQHAVGRRAATSGD